MQFSAYPGAANPWDELLNLAVHLEETGWDGIWLSDHLMSNQEPSGPYNEAWTTLAALATLVPRVRLGILVSGNTYRHPALLAKMAAQVDIISGGRLVLGLGAAWQENEHLAYGIPFYTTGERLRRLKEACQLIRGLFQNERTTFRGRYYDLRNAPLLPKPQQRPGPPLLIGGGGEEVTLRIVAQYADEWNVKGTPDELRHKIAILERHCADVGRDPSEIRRSAYATPVLSDDAAVLEQELVIPRPPAISGNVDQLKRIVQQYIDVGVDELVISPLNLGNAQLEREEYDWFMQEVVPEFR